MRYLHFFLLLLLTTGCGQPIAVPDLESRPDGPAPIFLIDEIDSMRVVDHSGIPAETDTVRLDPVKISDTIARALASRSTGSFTWTGDIPPGANLTALIGVGNAPVELFDIFGIIPPLSRYGPQDTDPPRGMRFELLANGELIFEYELSREEFPEWRPIEIDLSDHAGENVELEFRTEGVLQGTVLPYWGHPEIAAPVDKPRRVILLGLDTVAAGHVSWMGYRRTTTANLDEIAGSSTIFMDAHSSSPWTLPSFASVLSGRSPGITGADRRNRGLSEHEDMLAEIFRRNGFATAAFLNIPHLQEAGFIQGVDHQWEVHDEPAPLALEQAKIWLENHRSQDFFIFIHLFDPHIAYVPPQKWADRFRDSSYDGEYPDQWFLHGDVVVRNHFDPAVWAIFGEVEQKQCESLYDAEIAGMDEALGIFFDWYEEQGLMDDTLLIVFADHGEEFGEHDKWEHGHSQYEEQIHVPFFMKLPGQRQSRRVEGLVGTIDIYPTLLDLFGFESETDPSGQSLLPILDGGVPDPDYRVIAESTRWGPEIKTVVTNRFKYILNIPTGAEELYDLVHDPGETENILDQNPEPTGELGSYLEKYVSETQSGWHLCLLAGPGMPLEVDLTVTSNATIENPELITQIYNGSGPGLVTDGSFKFRVNLELAPRDLVEVRFSTVPENSDVTFSGTINGVPAGDEIRLGAFEMPLPDLLDMFSDDENQFETPIESDDLTLSIDDPVIAFSFPEYSREESRGAYLWSVPASLRAHEAALSPEQQEALESVGYLF